MEKDSNENEKNVITNAYEDNNIKYSNETIKCVEMLRKFWIILWRLSFKISVSKYFNDFLYIYKLNFKNKCLKYFSISIQQCKKYKLWIRGLLHNYINQFIT